MKKITIKFVDNRYGLVGLKTKMFLFMRHKFIIYDSTTFYDLFNWIIIKLYKKNDYDEYNLINQFEIVVNNNKSMHVHLNYKICKFLKIWKLNDLKIFFVLGIGGGINIEAGKIMASIRINPNEGNHKHTPHVHVYKDIKRKKDDCIRFYLNEVTVFDEDKKKTNYLYNKKEIYEIKNFIFENKKELIYYYNASQKG